MDKNEIAIKETNEVDIQLPAKYYMMSLRGPKYDNAMLNDQKIKTNNPQKALENFVKANNVKGTTVYMSEMKTTYRIGNIVFTDKELATRNAEIYNLHCEKQMLLEVIAVIHI